MNQDTHQISRTVKGASVALFLFLLFGLFMSVGLPLIIHYAGHTSWSNRSQASATIAFFWLGLGTLLWLLVIFLFAKNIIVRQIAKKERYKKLMEQGHRTSGTIINRVVQRKTRSGELLHLTISFKNMVGAQVKTNLDLLDTEPEKLRFEPGKSVSFIIDDNKRKPVVLVEGKGFRWNRSLLAIVVFGAVIILALPFFLLVYAYLNESQGNGWRFLSFSHPYILIPFILFIEVVLFGIVFRYLGNSNKVSMLLLHGKPATATITHSYQTGLSINEQPQVLINVEFEDTKGFKHAGSFKKIVSLLKLPDIAEGKQIHILYDPNHIQHIEMAE